MSRKMHFEGKRRAPRESARVPVTVHAGIELVLGKKLRFLPAESLDRRFPTSRTDSRRCSTPTIKAGRRRLPLRAHRSAPLPGLRATPTLKLERVLFPPPLHAKLLAKVHMAGNL